MQKGVVVKSTGSWYNVRLQDNRVIECRIRGKFRVKGLTNVRLTNPISVGDVVYVEEEPDASIIKKIEDRRNYIIRRSTNLSKEAHIIASNVDQTLLIVTINHPKTSTIFLDRFLASAQAYNIPAILVFNKIDLYEEEDEMMHQYLKNIYEKIPYKCLSVSALKGENIEQLRLLLKDKTTVLSGISGVGKSSLINKIDKNLDLKTGDISEAHDSGRHTTTFAQMHSLEFGGYIIDTPGVRSFGLVDMKKEEISHYFPEIFSFSSGCKFNNCTHVSEPSCAVRVAVENGEISEYRYNSYLSLMSEEGKYR